MSTFLAIIMNLLIVTAIVAQFVFMASLVAEGQSRVERYIRVLSFTSAILVVLGAKAFGTSIASVLVSALSNAKPLTVGIVGIVVPAIAGVVMAWYFVQTTKQRGVVIGTRILIFIGVMAVTQFADIYAAAVRENGVALDPALTPNISFVVGISIYLMLRWNPSEEGQARESDGAFGPGMQEMLPGMPQILSSLRDRIPKARAHNKSREEDKAKSSRT